MKIITELLKVTKIMGKKTNFHFILIWGYEYLPNHHVYSKALCQTIIQQIGSGPILNSCLSDA